LTQVPVLLAAGDEQGAFGWVMAVSVRGVSQMCYIDLAIDLPRTIPMSTTTIRLPEDLKARVASAAEQAGITAHAFILEAIADRALQAEARVAFVGECRERLAKYDATGLGVSWEDARQYALDRAAGKPVARPKARKIGR
jgi:predicted transcriptional regulator